MAIVVCQLMRTCSVVAATLLLVLFVHLPQIGMSPPEHVVLLATMKLRPLSVRDVRQAHVIVRLRLTDVGNNENLGLPAFLIGEELERAVAVHDSGIAGVLSVGVGDPVDYHGVVRFAELQAVAVAGALDGIIFAGAAAGEASASEGRQSNVEFDSR